jgi:hypothetical protein
MLCLLHKVAAVIMGRKSRKHALKTKHKSSALNFIANRGVQIVIDFNDPPPSWQQIKFIKILFI